MKRIPGRNCPEPSDNERNRKDLREACSHVGLLDRLQAFRLQQTKLAGTGDRFSAPVDLKFAKEVPRVSFHRVQGKE